VVTEHVNINTNSKPEVIPDRVILSCSVSDVVQI